jgi:hypothetical protein
VSAPARAAHPARDHARHPPQPHGSGGRPVERHRHRALVSERPEPVPRLSLRGASAGAAGARAVDRRRAGTRPRSSASSTAIAPEASKPCSSRSRRTTSTSPACTRDRRGGATATTASSSTCRGMSATSPLPAACARSLERCRRCGSSAPIRPPPASRGPAGIPDALQRTPRLVGATSLRRRLDRRSSGPAAAMPPLTDHAARSYRVPTRGLLAQARCAVRARDRRRPCVPAGA